MVTSSDGARDTRISELVPDVYVFNSYAATGIIVTSEGVIAVDAPMAESNGLIWRDFMRQFGPLKSLCYLEHHPDHTIGGHYLDPEFVIASEKTANEFGKAAPGDADMVRSEMNALAPDLGPVPSDYIFRRPTMTFNERFTITLGGRRFVLFEAPGHTHGSTILHAVDDRVAFVADAALPVGLPLNLHSGDPWEVLKSLAVLEMLDVDWYVPGHGKPFRRDTIPSIRTNVLTWMDKVRAMRAAGWSEEKIIAEGDLFTPDPEMLTLPGLQDPRESFVKNLPSGINKFSPWMQHATVAAAVSALEDRHPSAPQTEVFDPHPYWWEFNSSKETS
ncbi:MBL fold metallo-hydrolase [Streptomyces sp. NPDC101455]|uniref:MBL fold metallo-hydrolase n=1 Tax=Streptomyces sp. NPDC101455 TaxID=3366142 RepID=UPI0037F8B965